MGQRRTPAGSALRDLTALDRETFARNHWATHPLLVRAQDREAKLDLFALPAADELLSRRGLRTPFVRLVRDGVTVPERAYTSGGGIGARIADQLSDDRILTEFAAGATVVFQGLHRTWSPLIDFAGDLAEELGHPVQVNAYLTPSSSRGFGPHFDTHDVFVLQVAGRKHWRMHEPPIDSPLPDQEWMNMKSEVLTAAEGEPAFEATLSPGDCLYLPRGWIHAADALEETSLHLTIGVHPLTRTDLLREAFEQAARSRSELRQSLDLGFDVEDVDAIARELKAAAEDLFQALPALNINDVAIALQSRRWKDTRPQPLSAVAQAELAASVTPETRVALRPHVFPTCNVEGETLQVTIGSTRLALPASAADAVRRILSGETVAPFELSGDERAIEVVAQLLRAGVVVPVQP